MLRQDGESCLISKTSDAVHRVMRMCKVHFDFRSGMTEMREFT